MTDTPSIPIDDIEWEETGDEGSPASRLSAQINIASVNMHLEAWEVEDDADSNQRANPNSFRETDFDSLCMMMDCTFQTVEILGRNYVLIATPFGR